MRSAWPDIIDRDGHEAAVWSGPLTFDESVSHCLDRVVTGLNDGAGNTVLDYGCGIGRLTGPLHTRLASLVVGYDPEPRMVEEARRRHPDLTFWTEIPWESLVKVDNIVCVLVLQHLPKPEQRATVDRFRDLLLPSGRLVAQVAIGEDDVPLSHQWAEGDLADLFAGFEVRIEPDPVFPTWRWVYACL